MKKSKISGPSGWTIWLAWSKSCVLSALARAWERRLAALAGALTLGALGAVGVVVYWTAPWIGAHAMQAYAITVFERPAASAQQWDGS